MRGAVRLKDIALRLGVSVNTVSHALRDLPDIGADTKERVKKTASEMGYVANKAASFIRTGKSDVITVLIPSLKNPFYMICLTGIVDYLTDKGYHPLVTRERHSLDMDVVLRSVQSGACGVISFTDVTDEALAYCRKNETPLLLCGLKPKREDVSAIYCDDDYCGRLVAREALAEGAKRPCAVILNSTDRHIGFMDELEKHGLPCDVYKFNYWTESDSLDGIKRLVKKNRNDFIFCFNDEIAAFLSKAYDESGGFEGEIYGEDGIASCLPYSRPVKSVGGNIEEMGRRSAKIIVREIEHYNGKIVREIFPVKILK